MAFLSSSTIFKSSCCTLLNALVFETISDPTMKCFPVNWKRNLTGTVVRFPAGTCAIEMNVSIFWSLSTKNWTPQPRLNLLREYVLVGPAHKHFITSSALLEQWQWFLVVLIALFNWDEIISHRRVNTVVGTSAFIFCYHARVFWSAKADQYGAPQNV